MKYALLKNEKTEPQKGINDAVCPVCGELVIPKCGDIKMHHWAHKTKQNCDPWWENETEWHRKWKDCFPKEFQEVIMYDKKNGEKHVADVKTKTGFVIEFQHSSMNHDEQLSRENFYKNMVWLIDARDYYDRFKEHIGILKNSEKHKKYFLMTIDYCEPNKTCFPQRWLESSVPVVFDFGLHDRSNDENDKQKKWLYCIFPQKIDDYEITYCGMYITKEEFINRVSDHDTFFPNIDFPHLEHERLERMREQREEKRKMEEERRERQYEIYLEKFPGQKKWRDAIFKMEEDIKQNNLNPIKLYISNKGEIIDNIHSKCYTKSDCMVLSIKSSLSEYKGKEYRRNETLILIESGDEIITATAHIPTGIINDTWDFWNHYNYCINIIHVVSYYDRSRIGFIPYDTIYRTKKVKESLKYIYEQFSGQIWEGF